MAAILDFWTKYGIWISDNMIFEFLGPENVGLATKIMSISQLGMKFCGGTTFLTRR